MAKEFEISIMWFSKSGYETKVGSNFKAPCLPKFPVKIVSPCGQPADNNSHQELKFLVTIKSHLFWSLFSSSFVKNPHQCNGCLRFLPRLIKK